MLNNKQYLKNAKQGEKKRVNIDFIILCIISVLMLILTLFGFISQKPKALNNEPKTTQVKRLHLDTNGNMVSDNLISTNNTSLLDHGVQLTLNNAIITLNGTSTGAINVWYTNVTVTPNEQYYITDFTPVGQDKAHIYIRYTNNNGATVYARNGTFTPSTNTITWFVQVPRANIVLDNFELKPMLVKGNVAPTNFEPYGLKYYSKQNYEYKYEIEYNKGFNQGQQQVIVNYNVFANLQYKAWGDGYTQLLDIPTVSLYKNNGLNMYDLVNFDLDNAGLIKYEIYVNGTIKMSEMFGHFTEGALTWNNYTVQLRTMDGKFYQTQVLGNGTNGGEYGYFDFTGNPSETKINTIIILVDNYETQTDLAQYFVLDGIATKELAYNQGYLNGITDGRNEQIEKTTDDYKGLTYDQIYNIGYSKGAQDNYSLANEIGGVINLPFTFAKDALNFNILGLNVATLFLGSFSILLLLWVIKKLI